MYSKVYIEITNICNKSCTFCHKTKRKKRRMSFDEFKTVCGKLKGKTEYLYYHLMGEPLTHPLLPDFIEYASSMGFRSAVTTNGSLLAEKGDALIEKGVYKVSISVHSFEDGEKEEYERYLSDCFDFADKASKKGVLTVLRLWNKGYDNGRNISTLELLEKRFPKGKDNEWHEGRRGVRIRDKLHLEYGERFEWPDMNAKEYGSDVFCYGLKDHFGILVDGTVVPCCLDSEGNIPLGNIYESSADEILSSARAVDMFNGFSVRKASEELCKRCGYAQRFNKK
ncbi:MAG: radical SAM protein [Ruminococcaceae bacterium]|nr:radical SAM protein [Oscillospiraceae bacterium]